MDIKSNIRIEPEGNYLHILIDNIVITRDKVFLCYDIDFEKEETCLNPKEGNCLMNAIVEGNKRLSFVITDISATEETLRVAVILHRKNIYVYDPQNNITLTWFHNLDKGLKSLHLC